MRTSACSAGREKSRNVSARGSSIQVEVMSMDRKLWTEARAIAARHARGDRAEGEDLAQDLALAALEEAGAARNPAAWLERVGRNAAIARWRVAARRAELAPAIEPPTGPLDPEAALLGRERRGLVRRALAALPRPQRRAALARFHADLPYAAVAASVGAPPITARTRVHRALASLRARLGALRAMFFLPGVQMSALGVVLMAGAAPRLAPPAIPTLDEVSAVATRPGHHFARARVIAAGSHPAATPQPSVARRPAPPVEAADDAPPAVQRMVFGDDLVDGSVQGPDGEIIQMMPPVWHPSLIQIRTNFVPEMVKSLEDL
jgi:RNA polymerase sigma-70 factor (ECF subfamily)